MSNETKVPDVYVILQDISTEHIFVRKNGAVLRSIDAGYIRTVEHVAYEKAIEALKESHSTIHSEFCSRIHHEECLKVAKVLTELGELEGGE